MAFFCSFASCTAFAFQKSDLSGEQNSPQSWHDFEVERVDFSGVTVFPSQVIEKTLEINPGDKLDRTKVIRTEENIQSLYRIHGYENTSVTSRLIRKKGESDIYEMTLEFQVSEGNPARIGDVDLISEEPQDKISSKVWNKLAKKITAIVTPLKGDVFDQEKILESKRMIQELLVDNEYVGAQVEVLPVAVYDSDLYAHLLTGDKKVSRWVKLEFRVNLGGKVVFGFKGNEFFTRGYLSSIIDEQRLVGLNKDYISTIKKRLEEEYRSVGFARVAVEPYNIEYPERHERKVNFSIHEGPRVKIDSVSFDGNTVFPSQVLEQKFFSKASALIQHQIYVEKDVQKAADLLIQWMKERGYLSARVITISTVYVPKPRTEEANSSVRLIVYLYEGDQTKVNSITLKGNIVFSDDEIKNVLKLQESTPLNLFALSDGIETLKHMYFDKGYLSFKILNEGTDELVHYSHENLQADVFLDLEEGPQYRTSRIEIEGLIYAKEKIVRRELLIKENEVLSESLLTQSERRLRKLGIFSNLVIRTVDDSNRPGYKIVRISVQEAVRGSVTWGPGVRNDIGFRMFGQVAYTNLWGMNHTALLNASINRRFYKYNFLEGQAQFSYVWPWFGFSSLTFRPSISAGQTQYINFSAATLTMSSLWEKQLYSSPDIIGSFNYSWEVINQFNALKIEENQQLKIGSITPRLSLDFRDSPLAPTSGFYSVTWFDLADGFLGSQVNPPIGYYRAQFRGDYHLPIYKGIIWYFSFRTGYEQSFQDNTDPANPKKAAIPFIKQFALGGIGSLRGFQEQELNQQANFIGGNLSYVNYRTQLDLPFAGALKFGLFVDAANLRINSYSLGGLRYGTGFGFHYQTPVGPVNFDWGFKLDPRPSEDPYVIHFSVGVI